MAQYVKIYCAQKALEDSWFLVDHPESFGRCYAEKLLGAWFCCCCGKPVKVVEP